LYHTAILYPTRRLLAEALRRLIAAKIPLEGASDHGVSEALYLRDPDDNGVELYWDRPKEQWPKRPDGGLQMYTNPLDLQDLLAARPDAGLKRLPQWETARSGEPRAAIRFDRSLSPPPRPPGAPLRQSDARDTRRCRGYRSPFRRPALSAPPAPSARSAS